MKAIVKNGALDGLDASELIENIGLILIKSSSLPPVALSSVDLFLLFFRFILYLCMFSLHVTFVLTNSLQRGAGIYTIKLSREI